MFVILLSVFQDDVVAVVLVAAKTPPTVMSELASPPSVGIFEPIEISPSVIPRYPFPVGEPLPPMYPAFPPTYNPILTGRCAVNFSSISTILDRTAADCSQPLAAFVGNVICCPQFTSLLRLFQGYYSSGSDSKLALQDAAADDCFTDIVSILASRGANSSIATICSAKSLNLTGGSCPVKDINTFDKVVNTSKLLEACSVVDPLKECCRPVCQPAIMEAALHISASESMTNNMDVVTEPTHIDALNDCKGIVYSWISRKLSLDSANSAFRILSACKVNKGTTNV